MNKILILFLLFTSAIYSQEFYKKKNVFYYKPIKFMKLSLSSDLNNKQIIKLNNGSGDFNVAKIDMRMKFYITKQVSFNLGSSVLNNNTNFTTGLVIKF